MREERRPSPVLLPPLNAFAILTIRRIMTSETGYQRLEELSAQEEKHTVPLHYSRLFSNHKGTNIILFTFKAIVVAFACIGLWATIGGVSITKVFSHHVSKKPLDCNCGSSIEVAIRNGCRYDSMSTSWLPPHCRDDELLDEFERSGPLPGGGWPYYADTDGNVTVPFAEVVALAEKDGNNNTVWGIHGWHVAHCVFYWRKEQRMRQRGTGLMEKAIANREHIDHCVALLHVRMDYWAINARISPGLNTDDFGDDTT